MTVLLWVVKRPVKGKVKGQQPYFGMRKALHPLRRKAFSLAEMERFELSIPFWGIHDFQSCALDQLRDISMALIIPDFFIKVNRNFGQPQGNAPPIIKLDKVF